MVLEGVAMADSVKILVKTMVEAMTTMVTDAILVPLAEVIHAMVV